MKKVPIILLLTAFLLCNAGFYFSYLLGKIKIHAQVEAMMDHLKTDQLIAIADTAIQPNDWDEQDKEFSYKDEMYDVVRIDTVNGHEVYYSLNDSKETNLENAFADQIEKQQGNGKKATTVLFLKIVYAPTSNVTLLDAPIYLHQLVYPPLIVLKISSRPQDILHPPPTV